MTKTNIIAPRRPDQSPSRRIRGWGGLLLGVFLLWAFTFYLVPWVQENVPGMPRLTQVIKERDIDTTTFFYSETKESYEAERYLNETLGLSRPRGYDGFSIFFMAGIASCLGILTFGFWLMSPKSLNKTDDKKDKAC